MKKQHRYTYIDAVCYAVRINSKEINEQIKQHLEETDQCFPEFVRKLITNYFESEKEK